MGARGFGLGAFHFDHEPAALPQMIQHVDDNTRAVPRIETKRAFENRRQGSTP